MEQVNLQCAIAAHLQNLLHTQELNSLQEELQRLAAMPSADPLYIKKLAAKFNFLSNSTFSSTTLSNKERIREIEEELATHHSFKFANKKNIGRHSLKLASSRFEFLFYKHAYLIEAEAFAEKMQTIAEEQKKESWVEDKHPIMILLNIFKKIADILDDVWSILKGGIPPVLFNSVGPFITSTMGFFVHGMEGYAAAKTAYESYYNETMQHRKVHTVVGALSAAFAGVGVGLSIALFVGSLGAPVIGIALLPILIPAMLTCIYSLALVRNGYLYDQLKAEEHVTFEKLANSLKTVPNLKSNKIFFSHLSYCESLNKKLAFLQHSRMLASRRVAFNTIEVAGSLIVLVGNVLCAGPLIGAVLVESLGLLPLALLMGGVGLGFFSKWFDWFDEKSELRYTNTLRSWLVPEEPLNLPTLNKSYKTMLRTVISPNKSQTAVPAATRHAKKPHKRASEIYSYAHANTHIEQLMHSTKNHY